MDAAFAVRETMLVDVRYRVGTRPAEPRRDGRRTQITLDVVHGDDAAPVADLERRLGGQVLRHRVTGVDSVRGVMVVDGRCRAWAPRPQLRIDGRLVDGPRGSGPVGTAGPRGVQP